MNPKNSSGFDGSKIMTLIKSSNESTRLDFKKTYYSFSNPGETVKFIKHVIAFANVARRTDEECYIIFGVEDNSRKIFDIRCEYPGKKKPNFENPNVNFHDLMTNSYTEEFRKKMEEWILPCQPKFDFFYGFVEDGDENKFISYLVICPLLTSTHFKLKKSYGQEGMSMYDTYLRWNSSSLLVPKEEEKYILSKTDVAYLKRLQWKNIIDHHSSGDFKIFSDFTPYKNPKITHYDGESSLDYIIEESAREAHILIEADRGVGKSFFLHRIAYLLALAHTEDVTSMPEYGLEGGERKEEKIIVKVLDLEVRPAKKIPIYISLRAHFSRLEELDKHVVKQINTIAKIEINQTSEVFKIPGTEWVLLLDGVDELQGNDAPNVFETWIKMLPTNVHTIVTSRPDPQFEKSLFKVYHLEPLSKAEIFDYIAQAIDIHSQLTDPKYYESVKEWIYENESLLLILNNFRSLQYFLEMILGDYLSPKSEVDIPVMDFHSDDSMSHAEPPQNLVPKSANIEEIRSFFPDNDLTSEGFPIPDSQMGYVENAQDLSEKTRDIVFPKLAVAIQIVINKLEEDEVNRRRKLGEKTGDRAMNSRMAISKVSTDARLDEVKFDGEMYINEKGWINKSQLEWNEHMGIITPQNYIYYKFVNQLLQIFLAAEYLYTKENVEHVERCILHQRSICTHKQVIRSLVDLYNQLQEENGRPIYQMEGIQ